MKIPDQQLDWLAASSRAAAGDKPTKSVSLTPENREIIGAALDFLLERPWLWRPDGRAEAERAIIKAMSAC